MEPKCVTLEWIASPCNDMFADAVLSAVLQVSVFSFVFNVPVLSTVIQLAILSVVL